MNMLKVAVAASLALACGSAFAATTPLDTNILYVSGATAPDRTIFEGFVDTTNGICDTGLIAGQTGAVQADYDAAVIPQVFTTAASFSATSPANYTVFCRVKTGLTLAGTDIGIGKFSGGSETGIDPVATATNVIGTVTITYPDPANCTGTTTFVAPAAAPNDRIAYLVTTGCAAVPTVPQVGVSDVEPALFGATNAIKGNLVNDGALSTAFAPVVSRNFYTALQAAQGITDPACTNLIAGATEACMPNLTSVQVRALLSRKVTQVSKFFDGTTAFAIPAGGDQIRLCRRGNTSGTQKSFERLFFNQGCAATTPAVVMGSDSSINVGADNCNEVGCTPYSAAAIGAAGIFAGRGSGDVETCVDNANDNGVFAVGLLSTDRAPNDTTKQFSYVKIDGVAPSVERVVSQEYGYYTENVFLRPSAANTANAAAFAQGNRTSIYNNLLLSRVRTPANIAKTHSVFAFGRGGLTVRPATTTAPLASDTASVRPVTPAIRAAGRIAAAVNNCNEASVPPNDPIKN